MQGWQTRLIGEVFRVVNGGTPKTGTAAFWDGPHQWITPAEMGGLPSPYLASSRRTLTDEGLRVGAELVPPQSVILSSRAPIGHLVINEVPMAFNQGCKGLVPSPAIDTKFAYYFLLANVPLLDSLGTGATFKELSSGKLKEVPFHFPPLPEQRRIVAILDEAFEAIATAKANTEKTLQNARELFDQAKERIFLDGSTLWRSFQLDAIGKTQTGSTPKSSEPEHYGDVLPFIKPGDFRPDGTLDYANDGLSEHGASRARVVPAGSALMVCIGATIGKAGFCDRPIATNQQINAWTPNGDVSARFIYYQMTTRDFQRRVRENSGQATLPIINKSKWGSLAVVLPPSLEEQISILRGLDAIGVEVDSLREVLARKLTALDELKKSLLHQAFTGQITAKAADQQLEAVA